MAETLNLKCPLCDQPVSISLYQRITGIWKERNRVLSKIKAQQETLRSQTEKFKLKRAQLIQSAVERETRRLKRSFETLQRQKQIMSERADAKIQRLIALSHSKTEKHAQRLAAKMTRDQTRQLRVELRQSMNDKVKEEKRRVAERVTSKYEAWNNTLRSTLQQLKTQSKE